MKKRKWKKGDYLVKKKGRKILEVGSYDGRKWWESSIWYYERYVKGRKIVHRFTSKGFNYLVYAH